MKMLILQTCLYPQTIENKNYPASYTIMVEIINSSLIYKKYFLAHSYHDNRMKYPWL